MVKCKWILIFLLLSGCADMPSYRAQHVIETSDGSMDSCEYLGDVYGESPWTFLYKGVADAKNRALDQAAFLDATHVVWFKVTEHWKPIAIAKAYRCPE